MHLCALALYPPAGVLGQLAGIFSPPDGSMAISPYQSRADNQQLPT